MLTYQDLKQVPDNDKARAEFVMKVISEHKNSDLYKTARIAEDYDLGQNTTITNYQKTMTLVSGQVVPDKFSANHRTASNFFNIFITQLTQYLLGNGVTWKGDPPDVLGEDFDDKLQEAGSNALKAGVSFGMFNLDHVDVFSALEFAPIYDEEDGSLKAGVRFWQIDNTKPLRAMLYELDGYTNYMWSSKDKPSDVWSPIDKGVYMQPKRGYIMKLTTSEADGTEIYAMENYPEFPIVPMWGNRHHQSEIIGLRLKIDAYDLIQNGFENDLDNAQIYWIIKGAGGMDDPDLMRFLDRLRTVGAAAPADGQEVTPVTVNIPYEARERLLDRIEKQLYKDAMIMNPDDIAAGAATATQIRAAYERQNVKTDQFEYCVTRFVKGILKIAGVDNTPTYNRSVIVNRAEEVQTVINVAEYTSQEYTTKKILTILGDIDMLEEVKAQRLREDTSRYETPKDETDKTEETVPETEDVEE